MKRISGLLLALIVIVSLSAQKNVNVDNYRFKFTYRGSMPGKPQNPKFFYYDKFVNMPGETEESVSNMDDLYNALNIQGQRYIADNNAADFSVVVELNPVTFSPPEVKERVEEIKDKEGKITGRNHYYSVEITYSFIAKAQLKQRDKVIASHFVFNKLANSMRYQTKEYSSFKDANNNWKLQKDDVLAKIRNDLAFEAIRSTSSLFSSQYGFPESVSSDIIKTINEKKHPENTRLREMADRLKAKLESMTADRGLTEADVKEELNYFRELPDRYTDPKLKADVRLRYVGYYNVIKIYLYLDQPERVAEYADLLYANGHDKNDGKKLKEEAGKLIEQFNKSGIGTRHFDTSIYFEE